LSYIPKIASFLIHHKHLDHCEGEIENFYKERFEIVRANWNEQCDQLSMLSNPMDDYKRYKELKNAIELLNEMMQFMQSVIRGFSYENASQSGQPADLSSEKKQYWIISNASIKWNIHNRDSFLRFWDACSEAYHWRKISLTSTLNSYIQKHVNSSHITKNEMVDSSSSKRAESYLNTLLENHEPLSSLESLESHVMEMHLILSI